MSSLSSCRSRVRGQYDGVYSPEHVLELIDLLLRERAENALFEIEGLGNHGFVEFAAGSGEREKVRALVHRVGLARDEASVDEAGRRPADGDFIHSGLETDRLLSDPGRVLRDHGDEAPLGNPQGEQRFIRARNGVAHQIASERQAIGKESFQQQKFLGHRHIVTFDTNSTTRILVANVTKWRFA